MLIVAVILPNSSYGQIRFVDVTESAGIDFDHDNGAFGKKYLPETMGSGGAFFDYNGDGFPDILLLNGMELRVTGNRVARPALLRNNGNATFTEVTEEAGLDVKLFGMGISAADYDNDGDADLYVSGVGEDHLFQNQGNGRFKDVTKSSGLSNSGFGTSSAFFDFDRDGYLDLFVANYVRWSEKEDIYCTLDGLNKAYCTPEPYPGTSPRLFRNLGDGSFQDVTREARLFDETNKGLGVLVFDYNNDDWPDLMLANDTQPNKLWANQKDGTFKEIGVLAGIAFSEDGVARGAMGIDAGDYDQSGYESVLIGNFSNEMVSLYHNEGSGFFIDDAPVSSIGPASLLSLTFGCFFFDFDLDGYLDIFTANGHVENEISRVQKRVSYAQPPQLFRNLDGRRFKEVTLTMGQEFAKPLVARGTAYADYDNDGDLDILVTTCGGPPRLFRNDGGNRNNWLAVELKGKESNRDGIGSTVILRSGGKQQRKMVRTGGSYCSQSQLRLTFGLGSVIRVDSLEIRWPSGTIQVVEHPAINQLIRVEEGSSQQPRTETRIRDRLPPTRRDSSDCSAYPPGLPPASIFLYDSWA